jgi:hypothetical protein
MGSASALEPLGEDGGIVFTLPGGGIRSGGAEHSSSPASLFPGELLVLGSGPYGGVGGGENATTPAAETVQLVLQDSLPGVPSGVLQLVTLVQTGVSSEVARDPAAPDEGAESSLPEVMALVDESLQHLATPVGRLVESLLDFADWWTTPPAPSEGAAAPLGEFSPAGASADALEQGLPAGLAIETDADPSGDDDPAPEPGRGWLASMATLGMAAFAYASRRRNGRRSGGPGRSRDEGPSGSRAEDDPPAEPCSGGVDGVPESACAASPPES